MSSDIEVEVGAGPEPGEYVVRVIRAVAGGEPMGTLNLDVEELHSRREQLEQAILSSSVRTRRLVSAIEKPVRQLGLGLFEALFAGPVSGVYRASLGMARARGQGLRLVLRLTAPELAVLPWEAMFDPETETYLCRREPLVRHVPAPYTPDPLEVSRPLRILGLVASPRGLPLLDVEAEQEHLTEALAQPLAQRRVELHWVRHASWDGVHERLLAEPWHVVHFIGHGDFDPGVDEGVIALVGDDGRADLVGASRLADLLSEAQPTPRLVVLNSCSSGKSGTDLFSGTAAALVRSGIHAVAAMQFIISDKAAIRFARGFYTAVAEGRGIDEAARSGRIAILGLSPDTLEWVTPVLYLRGNATHLFTFTEAAASTPRIHATDSSYQHAVESPNRPVWERQRQRLINDVRQLHAARKWDEAIAAGQRLATFDPATPDPDGLITQAREALEEEALASRLVTGLQQRRGTSSANDIQAIMPRFDGLYEERMSRTDSSNQPFCIYLRFSKSGDVYEASSGSGAAGQIAKWLGPKHQQASRGKYEVHGQKISFTTSSKFGTVAFDGNISSDASVLSLNIHSHINGNRSKADFIFVAT